MFVYSKTIISFLKRIRIEFKNILVTELNIPVYQTRFLYKGRYIPFKLVVFEGHHPLGYFDSGFYQIALNKKLIYLAKDEVTKNILRHEIMHFISWLDYGDVALNHQEYFKKTCARYGYNEEIYKASINLESSNENITNNSDHNIYEKIKKLLRLACSDNPHEAELATVKANELLLNHNLCWLSSHAQKPDLDEEIYVKRVLEGTKTLARHHAIYQILGTFFVTPIFNHGKNLFFLEITGTRSNVELAEYVAVFLDHELERIYKIEKKKNPQLNKNSFMRGIGMGYTQKIKDNQLKHSQENELIALQNILKEQIGWVYGRLSSKHSASKDCATSLRAGSNIGKNLSINRALKTSPDSPLLLIKH